MSENLSSKTLFHFTKKEVLPKILENGFYAMYSREEIFSTVFNKKQPSHYIPMVSFCNIPLTKVETHCKLYGSYGIGLTKQWAKQNRINPVLYSYRNSALMKTYNESQKEYEAILKLGNKKKIQYAFINKIDKALRNNFIESLLFLKPLEGENKFGTKAFFYDEKEWRYVPRITKNRMHRINNVMIAYDKVKAGNIDFRYKNRTTVKIPIKGIEELNKKILSESIQFIESYKLSFKLRDIKFIIVKTDKEIPDMINYINRVFKNNINQVKILVTKIITLEQLKQDF